MASRGRRRPSPSGARRSCVRRRRSAVRETSPTIPRSAERGDSKGKLRRPWDSIGCREKSEILALVGALTLKDFAQLEALHLAGGGARQLLYGAQPFGTLVARQH